MTLFTLSDYKKKGHSFHTLLNVDVNALKCKLKVTV